MPIILAVEPDHKQAARLAAIVRHHVGAELVIGDTTERALDALGPRVPDMVLVPALLSPTDDASLAAALRVIAAAAHVRTLTIPVLASGKQKTAQGGLLSRWRRGRAESPEPDGCDPAVFAEQITAYLKEAAAERAERETVEAIGASHLGATSPVEPIAVAETFDPALLAAATEDEEIAAEAPVLDRWNERVAPPSHDHSLSADEPFGTYTLPPFDEVRAEASASLEASAAIEPRQTWDSVSAFETPAAFDEPGAFEAPLVVESTLDSAIDVDEPVVLEEPMVFDEPIVLSEPVVFEPPAIFEEPIVLQSSDLSDSPMLVESAGVEPSDFHWLSALDSPEVVEHDVVLEASAPVDHPDVVEAAVAYQSPVVEVAPVVAQAAAPAVKPVAFERSEVSELTAPVAMTPWRAWPPIEGVPIEVAGIAAATAKTDVPDWTELMASLRQDMERRRTQERRPAATSRKPRSKSAKPAVDEWGFFDPEQCGFSALLAKLDEITTASQ